MIILQETATTYFWAFFNLSKLVTQTTFCTNWW